MKARQLSVSNYCLHLGNIYQVLETSDRGVLLDLICRHSPMGSQRVTLGLEDEVEMVTPREVHKHRLDPGWQR